MHHTILTTQCLKVKGNLCIPTMRISQLPFSATRGQCYKKIYHGNLLPFHDHTVILWQHYVGNYSGMAGV